MNGFTITATQRGSEAYGTFHIPADTTFHVAGEGAIRVVANVTAGISVAMFQNDGTLNIYGGTYEINQAQSLAGMGAIVCVIDNCASGNDAVVNIDGGTFAVTGEGANNILRNWPIANSTVTLNIYNGLFKANTAVAHTYLWNKNDTHKENTHSVMNFYGGTYEAGVVYEDYDGQDDIYVSEAATKGGLKPYSGNT